MKLFSRSTLAFLIASASLSAVVVRAVDAPSPDGASCWSYTGDVIQNEVEATLDPSVDISVERSVRILPGHGLQTGGP